MKLRHVFEPKFGHEDEDRETHTENSFRFELSPDNIRRSDDSSVIVRFDRFGRGEKPRTYEVEVDWLDMKWLLQRFVEADQPHAEHLMRILKMVRRLDDCGWQNTDEPPEFWENLLEE